jgi:ABC-type transport system involved in cytochrome c biogenesis permease subunit
VEQETLVLLQQVSTVTFWFAFALYVGATVLYGYQFILRRHRVGWWARFLTGAGFILQTISIGVHSTTSHGTLLDGPNQLVLASWALVLLYFTMEHVLRIRSYGAFLIPVAVAGLAASQLFAGGQGLKPGDTLYGSFVGFHVFMIVFANAGFVFGAVSAGLYLYQDTQLRNHKANRFSRKLPSLSVLQLVARRSIALAFPVYCAGLSLGVVKAIQFDVNGWWSDPRIMMSGLVLVTFATYLVLTYRREASSRFVAWVSIAGMVFVIGLAVIARTLPVGFHVFGL